MTNRSHKSELLDHLLAIPCARRLLEIVRSDNPILALSVTKREISWTQFLAWLIDPVRQPGPATTCFVSSLLESARPQLDELIARNEDHEHISHLKTIREYASFNDVVVNEVRAEVTAGKSGRCDLLVNCSIGKTPLVILIENKIESTERKDQLQGYVDSQNAKLPANGILIPLLIDLCDEPAEASTCEWAVVWNRGHVKEWCKCAKSKCQIADVKVSALVRHYEDLFEAWDISLRLREEQRLLIARMSDAKDPPPEWKLLENWLSVGNEQFFNEVQNDERLKSVMAKLGLKFVDTTTEKIRGQYKVLQISKSEWSFEFKRVGPETINVHFESRHPGHLCLDVEVAPYEGGIANKPERIEQLATQLKFKAELLDALRSAFQTKSTASAKITPVTKGLLAVDNPSTNMAVKFTGGLEGSCMPNAHADFLADVFEAFHDEIDAIIAQGKERNSSALTA